MRPWAIAVALALAGCHLALPLSGGGDGPPPADLPGPVDAAPDLRANDSKLPPDDLPLPVPPDQSLPPDGLPALTTVSTLSTALVGPTGAAFDQSLGLLVADENGHRIWRFDPTVGKLESFAGTGAPGAANTSVNTATFDYPRGLAIHGPLVLVADRGNNLVRRIEGGFVGTYAGTGPVGFKDGLATAEAMFNQPSDVCVDAKTGVAYVADRINGKVRKIHTGIVGSLPPSFFMPLSVVAHNNTLYVSEGGNVQVMDLTSNTVTATVTGFNTAAGLTLDVKKSRLYVADLNNHCIKVIDLLTNQVSILAGQCGLSGGTDGDALSQALFSYPWDVALDAAGSALYVVEKSPPRLRKVAGLPP